MKVHYAWQSKAAALALSLTAIPFAGDMYAQELSAQTSDPGQGQAARALEEVIVTARRREESAQSIPVSVNAFDAGALETLQIKDLDDLQDFSPSLTVSATSGRPNAPVYSLRGIRPTESIYGQDPTVAVYFSDVVMRPANATNLSMYDLQSVQVLKGPQGTLFGRNSTGGAILLTPKRPGDMLGGNIMFGFGNYGHREAEFGFDAPVADNFAMRFAGRWKDSDGYQSNHAPGRLGEKRGGGENRSLRASAVWDLSENVENYTILTWDELDLNGRTAVLQAVNPNSVAAFYDGSGLPSIFDAFARTQSRDVHDIESDLEETSEAEVWGIFNTTTAELSDDLTLKSIIGYRNVEYSEDVDMDASSIDGLLHAFTDGDLEHSSVELQLQGNNFDDKLDWTAGIYGYQEEGIQQSPGIVLRGLLPDPLNFQSGEVDNKSYSIFGQATYQFSDAWSVTGGGRWTYDDKKMTLSKPPNPCNLFDDTGAPLPNDQCFFKLEETFQQPTWTLSLEYTPQDDLLVYLASRTGYRAGGFNLRADIPAETEPFDSETVLDLEAGIKSDWFVGNWSMRTNVAAYHTWYDDIQRTISLVEDTGQPGSAVRNAAKASVFGIEIEQEIAPTDNLSLTLKYAYTDPEYDEWTEPSTGADNSDMPFTFTPEHALSTVLSYTYPMEEAGLIRLTATASYQDDIWVNSLHDSGDLEAHPPSVRHALQQDSYWLASAKVDWEQVMNTNWDISLYGKNLTDEEYTVGGVMLYHSFGFSTKVFGEPRTYGMQARYRF